ncbi:response regulator [Hymenobacter terricola]|uniref:response regulator n=1 Tax=Hymenobacter terricola TaxID=2819236 RepID=UPI001B30E672|nr:response regulator [Hymenobacter terricola]
MLTYLIDDDAVSLFVAEQTLRLEGFMAPIIPFVGAEEALAYLLPRLVSDPPKFIFLDLNMPVMDGWGFLDVLAPHAAALKDWCRIYLLTSSLALVDTEKAQSHALVHGLIHKPLDEDGIRAAILERNRTAPTAARKFIAPINQGGA